MSKATLRSSAFGRSLHSLVVALSSAGLVHRSESVSLLPPLCLTGKLGPDSVVLDMCAAPGNKTAVLMDIIGMTKIISLKITYAFKATMDGFSPALLFFCVFFTADQDILF